MRDTEYALVSTVFCFLEQSIFLDVSAGASSTRGPAGWHSEGISELARVHGSEAGQP